VLIRVAQVGIVVGRLTGKAVRGRAVRHAFGPRLFVAVLRNVLVRLSLWV